MALDLFAGCRVSDYLFIDEDPENAGTALRKAIYRDPDGNEIGFGGSIG